MSFYIDFNPKYTKTEKYLLQKIIKDFLSKKKTTYDLRELKIPKIKNDMENFLERFVKKGISFVSDNYKGTFLPISHYFIKDTSIDFFLSTFLEDALLERNELSNLHLKFTLLFEEHYTKDFYYSFVIKNIRKREFLVTLDELKLSLNFNEYERFYDFERNVLKKLKYDIDTHTDYILEFEKEKRNDFKNSKITGLMFKITDKNSEEKIKLTNNLISSVSSKTTDYKRLYDLIYSGLDSYLPSEIENFLQKSLTESKKRKLPFESVFEDSIRRKSNYKLISEFQGKFNSPVELDHMLKNVINGLNLNDFSEKDINSTKLIMKLYFCKEGEVFDIQKNGILVNIKYSKKDISLVKIYETI